MSSNAMSLKGRINNYAKKNNIAAQVVLQNYMFERFLDRLSRSEYQEKFIIKGGMLVAAIVGLNTRSTMDLDTTLRNLKLTEVEIRQAVQKICDIGLDDDVTFKVLSIDPIRKDDIYGGFCVRLNAIHDSIVTPLAIDISTGDVITPDAVFYEFVGIFDEAVRLHLWGYNIETVLAEKVETILSRGIFSTRPRDYYDVYILVSTQKFDKNLFREALYATAIHRGSNLVISEAEAIVSTISENSNLKDSWNKYQMKFPYASNISYEEVIYAIKDLVLNP